MRILKDRVTTISEHPSEGSGSRKLPVLKEEPGRDKGRLGFDSDKKLGRGSRRLCWPSIIHNSEGWRKATSTSSGRSSSG